MSDLRNRLDALAGPASPPSTDTMLADLARGRAALRHRRTGRILAGSTFAAAAVVAAALAVPGLYDGPATSTATPAAPPAAATAAGTVKLVAYTGKQPAGFTLDRVPDGWEVQGVDKYVLTLAPIGIPDQDMSSFVGKIAITLSDSAPDVKKQDVVVGGKPAVLATMEGETVPSTIFQKRPDGTFLTIQVWEDLGWSPQSIVEFAGGVHVKPGAGLSVG
jgi:hypothetical protein